MKSFYKLLTKLDYGLLGALTAIIIMGLFVLDSAAASKGTNYVLRQSVFILAGVIVILCSLRFDYTILKKNIASSSMFFLCYFYWQFVYLA